MEDTRWPVDVFQMHVRTFETREVGGHFDGIDASTRFRAPMGGSALAGVMLVREQFRDGKVSRLSDTPTWSTFDAFSCCILEQGFEVGSLRSNRTVWPNTLQFLNRGLQCGRVPIGLRVYLER